ncbi:MAG: cytochrome D1 domain-containing protein [Deltaproteobacteria bacterium]|nr:cytochrome D1 domain-containing protein [Deltaproteobacteria bacterium]
MKKIPFILLCLLLAVLAFNAGATERKLYGTASLMVVVERESGSVLVIDSIEHEPLGRVAGLGDLRHASMVFSRDARYAFVISTDGFLSKVDLLKMELAGRVKAGDKSIGVAISRDNRYLMVCNYSPGSAVIIDAATLGIVKEIPAIREDGGKKTVSKTVGPLDTPDNLMIFALMEGGGVWVVDMRKEGFPVIRKFWDVGTEPYDQLITPDGRYYLVGLKGSEWMGLLDTWKLDGVKRIDVRERKAGLKKYKKPEEVPVYHIPHFESWSISGDLAFVPAFGERRVIVYSTRDWSVVKSIPIDGTGLFVVGRPGGRDVWVDNVGPSGGRGERLINVIDVETLDVRGTIDAGKGALDPQFTPRGEAAYVSIRDEDKVAVYDADTLRLIKEIPAKRPSGIFSSDRASKFGL